MNDKSIIFIIVLIDTAIYYTKRMFGKEFSNSILQNDAKSYSLTVVSNCEGISVSI